MQSERHYHIYNRANGSENLFRSDDNYNYFLRKYEHYIDPIAETYAYCLMPNHFHFLIKIKSEKILRDVFSTHLNQPAEIENLSNTLSKQFGNLFNAYSKAYNKMYNRHGSLFSRPFKQKEVETEEYFTTLVFYIHNNPVNHGFLNNLEEWKHSSYQDIISEKPTFLSRKSVLHWFYGRTKFIDFHNRLDYPKAIFEL